MSLPFRDYHLVRLLGEYDQQRYPLDIFMSNYFREHKACGSKDRRYIAETAYTIMRWKGLLDYLCGRQISWSKRYDLFKKIDLKEYIYDNSIPAHIRCSFPEELFDYVVNSYGEEKALELGLISNAAAPTTVRVNTLKSSRDDLLKRWKGVYDVESCTVSPIGIVFKNKINFFATTEFKEGLFEIQDEGSQLLANLVGVSSGQQVMDYCAGAGGKSLAFASKMGNKGQIFLHDIRSHALQQARKRLKRAGIHNAQIVESGDKAALKKLKKRMDWVLVDAPCSGSGTLRRNPDMKWKFESSMVERLVGEQRSIFEKALSYLKVGGHIVYATCSIFKEENEQQVDHFLSTYHLEICGEAFKSLPQKDGMDGFFGAVFKKLQ